MNRNIFKDQKVKNAIYIGTLCSVSYLVVYTARNILGAVTPKMIENGFTEGYIGKASSIYFILYAVGHLINGLIGDKIKARNMISIGLLIAGITIFLFSNFVGEMPEMGLVIYGLTGFFLSMIYAPMTKVVAENTEPMHASMCSLGYTFASFFGSPIAGAMAAVLIWENVFLTSSIALEVMAVICFMCFIALEKKGVVKYNQYDRKKKENGNINVLIENSIMKYTIVSVLTGVVRTTVVFWMPTYISQYLGFSAEKSAVIFTGATFVISFTTFIAMLIYEKLKRNLGHSILVMFSASAIFFALLYLVKQPALNIVLLVLAIMASNGAATMLWSVYCPGLRDTGMVSSATGFLGFMSYMAAAVSSTLFANSVSTIGWGNLILVWCVLMISGILVVLPYRRRRKLK